MKTTDCQKKTFNQEQNKESSPEKRAAMLKTRASSIYHQLTEEGCQPNDIISLSSHLISFVTTDLKMNK